MPSPRACFRPSPAAFLGAALAALGGIVPALAEGEPPATAAAACAGKAALYGAERGLKVWVTRRGTMALGENPLRPLSRDEVVVLQVVVNGRLATAWGPDYDNLRQGAAPRDLERDGTAPIRWDNGLVPYPDTIRVVAEDGRVLFGPLKFAECGEAPAGRPVAGPKRAEPPVPAAGGARRPSAADAGTPRGPAASGPPVRLPQGALPGLELEKGEPGVR